MVRKASLLLATKPKAKYSPERIERNLPPGTVNCGICGDWKSVNRGDRPPEFKS